MYDQIATALTIGGYVIGGVACGLTMLVGVWALMRTQVPEDNYKSPTIRDNVKRVK